ncbi:MAG: CRTAC1 family protein [Myxococcota bacterium]|nr:CRTAC1 family protein [Myxococcota bacterium]
MTPLHSKVSRTLPLLLLFCSWGCPAAPPGGEGDGLSPSEAEGRVDLYALTPAAPVEDPALFVLAGDGIQHEHLLQYSTDDRWLDDYGGGMAAMDCDGDGDIDLFFTVSLGEDRLYRNLGDGRFEEVSDALPELTGVSTAATAADFDNDGDPDLLVLSQHSSNALLVNQGDCRFEDGTEEAGLTGSSRSVHASWVDLDRDGWLDLYVTNWAEPSPDGPVGLAPVAQADRFWRSRGDGTFADHSADLPDASRESLGMVTGFFDYDQDGDADLLMSNDRGILFGPHRLFRNGGQDDDGGFLLEDATTETGFDLEMNGMGLALSDIDGDEDVDVLLTGNFETILQWQEPGLYIESGLALGLNNYDPDVVSWAGIFLDADADGDEDLYFVQSSVFPHGFFDVQTYGRTPLFFRNDIRSEGRFNPVAFDGAGADEQVTRSLLAEDFDGDGLPDVAHGNVQSVPRVLRTSPAGAGSVLVVELQGSRSNRDGRGAVVRVHAQDGVQTRWVGAVEPFGSGSSLRAYFGLGDAQEADRIEVLWPSGIHQDIGAQPTGYRIRITEPDPG